jgi:hypothetical protein
MSVALRERSPALPSSSDGLAQSVSVAQAELRTAVERAGLRRDPYAQVVDALSATLGLFPQLTQQLDAAVERGREPLDDTALERLQRAAATGADRRAAELARAHAHRTMMLAITVLMLIGCAGLAGGYWWGRADAWSNFRTTDAALAVAFRDGPATAVRWLNLMRWNSLPEALKACDRGQSFIDQESGRRACSVPLWLEPPKVRAPG